MKYAKLIFLSTLVICLGLSIRQKDNLKNIWTEYWNLQKSFDERIYKANIPAIDKKVEKIDPEAAAIINFRLGSFSREWKSFHGIFCSFRITSFLFMNLLFVPTAILKMA